MSVLSLLTCTHVSGLELNLPIGMGTRTGMGTDMGMGTGMGTGTVNAWYLCLCISIHVLSTSATYLSLVFLLVLKVATIGLWILVMLLCIQL